jgi:hypothetical protein
MVTGRTDSLNGGYVVSTTWVLRSRRLKKCAVRRSCARRCEALKARFGRRIRRPERWLSGRKHRTRNAIQWPFMGLFYCLLANAPDHARCTFHYNLPPISALKTQIYAMLSGRRSSPIICQGFVRRLAKQFCLDYLCFRVNDALIANNSRADAWGGKHRTQWLRMTSR